MSNYFDHLFVRFSGKIVVTVDTKQALSTASLENSAGAVPPPSELLH